MTATYIDARPRIVSFTSVTLRDARAPSVLKVLKKFGTLANSLQRDRNVASAWAWMHAAVGRQPEIMRRSDFYRVLHTAKSPSEQMACVLMMREGFRSGEVRLAKHDDVELDYSDIRRSVIYVFDIKDKRHYPIPVHPDLAVAYENLPKKTGFLVTHGKAWPKLRGKPLTKVSLNDMVKRWAKREGIRDWNTFCCRKLRVFFAKEWMHEERDDQGRVVKEAGDLFFLSKILRHHEPFTTWIYLQSIVYVEEMDAEMRRMYRVPQFMQNMENVEV